ncbi:transglycosylase family protein [Streptomyces spectabilis]|uniref:LysM peptidoglycan-binding domain-containing protein n=1 Tax=Streptomyces spectabilis TaxID=68270 RepID=A0A516R8J1_STRST|nr:transglycosylase family protein [Streptomyces spectabilis]QDQ11979.1 LysM peptidoglycan-binding domain-containing protein [Streptomyces spectabilis]
MLSGQGRHRRPRQVPAILVTAGVTGSAIAIPLLGASSASAADAETWDKVAECESGGAWSAKGSGYYGGLQLTQDTWEQYGGLSYAPTADQASRSQQIHVAEKVLADRGPQAWPNCAPAAGLAKGGEAAAVDPGLPSAPPSSDADDSAEPSEPSGPSDSSRSGKESKGSKDEDAKKEREGAESDGSEKAEKPGSSPESRDKTHDSDTEDGDDDGAAKGGKSGDDAEDGSREGGGKHRKPAGDADKSGADDSASPEQSEGAEPGTDDDASDGRPSGRHRGGSAAEDAPSGDTGPGRHASRGEARDVPGAERPSGTYTVRSGDNLSAIADSHDLDGGWSDLYAGNKKTVGSDPDLILPGQRLELSADDKGGTDGKSSEK